MVAVLNIDGGASGLHDQHLALITDGARDAVRKAVPNANVLTSDTTATILRELGTTTSECLENAECSLDIFREFQADTGMTGTVLRLGSSYIVQWLAYDVASGKLLGRGQQKVATVDILIEASVAAAHTAITGEDLGVISSPTFSLGTTTQEKPNAFTNGITIDVEEKLREKACREQAEITGTKLRSSKMSEAVKTAADQATNAWKSIDAKAERCAALDFSDRAPCISAVATWLEAATTLEAILPAGQELVTTDCGPREAVFAETRRAVTVAEIPTARALLNTLNQQSQTQVPTQQTADINDAYEAFSDRSSLEGTLRPSIATKTQAGLVKWAYYDNNAGRTIPAWTDCWLRMSTGEVFGPYAPEGGNVVRIQANTSELSQFSQNGATLSCKTQVGGTYSRYMVSLPPLR